RRRRCGGRPGDRHLPRAPSPEACPFRPGVGMIGKLKGIVEEIGEDHVLVDVHNVGYVVHCGARTLANLPPRGEAVTLYIETYLREDQLRLFGFATALEREWFRLL